MMYPFGLLFGGISLSLILSAVILIYLRDPLLQVYRDLCPTGTGVAFWLRFTRLMVLIAPLILVVFFSPVEQAFASGQLVEHVRRILLLILTGQFLGLVIIGRGLWRAVFPPRPSAPANRGRPAGATS